MYINKESLRFDSSHLYTATTWKFSDIYLLSKGQNINNYPFCITTVNKGTQVLFNSRGLEKIILFCNFAKSYLCRA